jgi:hypothetical protein
VSSLRPRCGLTVPTCNHVAWEGAAEDCTLEPELIPSVPQARHYGIEAVLDGGD